MVSRRRVGKDCWEGLRYFLEWLTLVKFINYLKILMGMLSIHVCEKPSFIGGCSHGGGETMGVHANQR